MLTVLVIWIVVETLTLCAVVESLRRAVLARRDVRDLRDLVSRSSDGGPYRLRLVEKPQGPDVRLLKEGQPAAVYCEDCRFRAGSAVYVCAAYPSGSGFTPCVAVNKDHDCAHFQQRHWWNAAS